VRVGHEQDVGAGGGCSRRHWQSFHPMRKSPGQGAGCGPPVQACLSSCLRKGVPETAQTVQPVVGGLVPAVQSSTAQRREHPALLGIRTGCRRGTGRIMTHWLTDPIGKMPPSQRRAIEDDLGTCHSFFRGLWRDDWASQKRNADHRRRDLRMNCEPGLWPGMSTATL